MAKILIIEPYYGGSHKQLLDTILEGIYHTFFIQLLITAYVIIKKLLI